MIGLRMKSLGFTRKAIKINKIALYKWQVVTLSNPTTNPTTYQNDVF
jgi:hypothetical protein